MISKKSTGPSQPMLCVYHYNQALITSLCVRMHMCELALIECPILCIALWTMFKFLKAVSNLSNF